MDMSALDVNIVWYDRGELLDYCGERQRLC